MQGTWRRNRPPWVLLVTGRRQEGKTSSVLLAVHKLRQKGLCLGGILALGEDHHGQREGFRVVDLQTGKRAWLCRRTTFQKAWVGRYQFYPEGLALAYKALAPDYLQGVDLIIVDEVGPLELQGQGLARALDRLVFLPTPQVWVVRKALVKEVSRRWGLSNTREQRVSRPKDPVVYQTLAKLLFGDQG